MRLSPAFIVLAVVLTGACVTLLWLSVGHGNLAFYITEGVILVCVLLLFTFYSRVIKPLDSIAGGIDLLREQDFSSRLSPVGQREADRIVEMFNGIMSQLKEERLHVREQNHFMDLLIAASPMGIIILDGHDRITMSNRAAMTFLGGGRGEEMTGKYLTELKSPLGVAVARLPKGEAETVRLSDSMIYRCSRLSFMDKGYAHPFIMIEELTSEVIKAEKKAYEKVIRMIAHEVNNSIAGVNSMLDVAAASMDDSGDADLAEMMRVCMQRFIDMSRFITNFAAVVKIPDADMRLCDLNRCISDSRVLLESMCSGHGIGLRMELCDAPVEVMLDRVLMEQVIINMVKNSVESIGENGCVTISTSVSPASFVVTDNGPGLSQEAATKLFSPFYSSKPDGQGIGLLFISDVLNKHNCSFSLRTGDDGLTRFTVRFPR